jgi:hypothetical protein
VCVCVNDISLAELLQEAKEVDTSDQLTNRSL